MEIPEIATLQADEPHSERVQNSLCNYRKEVEEAEELQLPGRQLGSLELSTDYQHIANSLLTCSVYYLQN